MSFPQQQYLFQNVFMRKFRVYRIKVNKKMKKNLHVILKYLIKLLVYDRINITRIIK